MEEKSEKVDQPVEVVIKVPLQNEAPKKEEPKITWRTAFLCTIWFLATICNTFLVKILFRVTKFELISTIMIVQLASIALYSWTFSLVWGVPKNKKEVSWRTYLKLIFPVAVSIFIRTRIKDYLIWTTPISDPFSLGVEAFYPLFVLLFGRKLLAAEEDFDYHSSIMIAILSGGFVFGFVLWDFYRLMLIEMIAFSIMTAFEMTYSKKIMQETGIHPTKLLPVLSFFVLLGLLPMWLTEMHWRIHSPYTMEVLSSEVITGVFIFGALSWVQTVAAFGLLSILPIHNYLIGNGCNRVIRTLTFALVATFCEIGYRPGDFAF